MSINPLGQRYGAISSPGGAEHPLRSQESRVSCHKAINAPVAFGQWPVPSVPWTSWGSRYLQVPLELFSSLLFPWTGNGVFWVLLLVLPLTCSVSPVDLFCRQFVALCCSQSKLHPLWAPGSSLRSGHDPADSSRFGTQVPYSKAGPCHAMVGI